MKIITLSLVAALATTSAFADINLNPIAVVESAVNTAIEAPAAVADLPFEVSANMAITSNYLWRNMSQTSNSAGFQAGIDLGYNGFYIGTWGSNISWTSDNTSSLEADLYAGYAGEAAGIGYDIGYIIYSYPNATEANNFEEAYLGLSKDFGDFGVNAKYSLGMHDGPDDIEVGANTQLEGFGLSASYGDYDTIGTRYSAAISKEIGKFEVSLGYYSFTSDASSDADEDNVVLTIGTSF
jgi:uncharacterized protein (TIGR02001 family)